jgi:guanine deaminase
LQWLETSIFPLEAELADKDEAHLKKLSRLFLNRLAAHGTTTAMVFGVSVAKAQEAFLKQSAKSGLRIISGLCLMDRNAPEGLLPSRKISWWEEQIEKQVASFQGKNIHYSICPRYAPSCSEQMLSFAGDVLRKYPSVFLQTHICENHEEIEIVKRAFAGATSYSSVYERHGLLTPRTFLAHFIHPEGEDIKLVRKRGAHVIHCPSANLFLGSGLFPFANQDVMSLLAGLGTDIGAGTTLSVFQNAGLAIQVALLQGVSISIEEAFLLTSFEPAQALGFSNVGWLGEGASADFVVLGPQKGDVLATELWTSRQQWSDKLFLAMTTPSASFVTETWAGGVRLF